VTGRRIAIEAAISAGIAFLVSLIVFGPLLGSLDVGWAGGDMLSTYVNATAWSGFSYAVTTQFGFPLGMNLNYFPGIDITENTFAHIVNAVTGTTFLGINLLVLLSFPLVAALAYLVIRMTGLRGPLAISLAVAFTFIPFHWGRALGHTYLSTLYSVVVGVALVLLIGSGGFERMWRSTKGRSRVGLIAVITVMCVVVAWTGVYYVVFTLILGAAALLWRIAQRASAKQIGIEAIPFVGIAVLAVIGFLPSLLTVRGDPPLASLGDRIASESVTYAGNLAMAILPIPQSSLPRGGYYNEAVLRAFADAPYGESNVITNFGTWVTAAALLTLVVGLVLRSRRPEPTSPASGRVTLGFITYLLIVSVLFFVPWGLNFLFAELVTAQIRGWNRLLPVLLLLFLVGAAAVLHRTRIERRWAIAVPVALVVLGLTAVDSVYPFKAAYAGSVAEAGEATQAARAYASAVNSAIPQDCGVLQLPYMAYPEHGVERGINDYDHFWTSITNPGKQWSYGSVKFTDASTWAAQLPQVPTDEQVALLRQAGFCAIHLDTRGYISEALAPVADDLTARFGAPVATGFDDAWQLYDITAASPADAATTEAFLHQPFISVDYEQVTPRETALQSSWWWARTPSAEFGLTPTSPEHPLTQVSGSIAAPECGALPVTVTLTAGSQSASTTVIARPNQPAPFALTLDAPSAEAGVLTVDTPGEGCPVDASGERRFAQVLDLTPR
jgi:hypothetical protein